MPLNAFQKSKKSELEFAEVLRSYGAEARRGRQFSGSPDSPDVWSNIRDIHWEVKRQENFGNGGPYGWLEQAGRDSRITEIPIVTHRQNHKEWIAILKFEDLMQLLREAGRLPPLENFQNGTR